MENDWLIASSFERMYETISAINILSIHAKLVLAGVADPTEEKEIGEARIQLLEFLGQFQGVLQQALQSQDGTIVGADPRLNDLAMHYRLEQRQVANPSILYTLASDDVERLVISEEPENLRRLVEYLRELRSFVEQHYHDDIIGILGEV